MDNRMLNTLLVKTTFHVFKYEKPFEYLLFVNMNKILYFYKIIKLIFDFQFLGYIVAGNMFE